MASSLGVQFASYSGIKRARVSGLKSVRISIKYARPDNQLYMCLGSIHFSLLTGRILLKDVRYHSSNQTIKVVTGQLQWRYWTRRPTSEEDLNSTRGEDGKIPFASTTHYLISPLNEQSRIPHCYLVVFNSRSKA